MLLSTPHRTSLIQGGYFFCLLLVAISLFSPKLGFTNLAIALLSFVWVLEGNFVEKYKNLKANPAAISFIVLFVLYLIGVFYTEDTQDGVKSLETKAPLLIFPLLLGTTSIKREYLHKTLLTFAYTCTALSLVALVFQIFVVLEKNDFNYFFSDGLVSIMGKKAVYYAIYVAFSILILVDDLWSEFYNASLGKKAGTLAVLLFLLLFLFLLASRTSLGILLLILVTTLVVAGIRRGQFRYTGLLVASLIAFILGLSIAFPQTVARFKSLRNVSYDFTNTDDMYHFSGADNDTQWNGLNLRLAKWVCALDVIKQYPLAGVGTGDVKNEMVVAYKRRNFMYAAEGRFDPHNQYLHTAVGIGLPGLMVLLISYLLPIYLAIKRKSWLLATFTILLMSSSLTESVLSSAQGIIFFCFFLFMLLKATFPGKPANSAEHYISC